MIRIQDKLTNLCSWLADSMHWDVDICTSVGVQSQESCVSSHNIKIVLRSNNGEVSDLSDEQSIEEVGILRHHSLSEKL